MRAWLIDPDAVLADSASSSHVLEYVRSYGPGALPDDFGYDGPVSASGGGLISVASARDCRVGILDRATGELLRYFGRCGDGPHDLGSVFGEMGWIADTLVVVDPTRWRINLWGPDDTIVRRIGVQRDGLVGAVSVQNFAVADDTTGILSIVRVAVDDSLLEDAAGVLADVDLRTGMVRNTWLREVFPLDGLSDPGSRRTYHCVSPDGRTVIADNGGVPEIMGLSREGEPAIRWSRLFRVDGVRRMAKVEYRAPPGMHWRRVPHWLGCGGEAVVARLLVSPGMDESPDSSASPGRIVALTYHGDVLLNEALVPEDLPLVHAGWYADDSFYYVSTSRTMSPQILAFRLVPRTATDRGAFRISEAKRMELVHGVGEGGSR